MKNIILSIKGLPTLLSCVDVDNSLTYVDTIIKNKEYTNISTKTIKVTNKCNKSFFLAAKTLFSQQDAYGSTFRAYMNDFTVPANTTIQIPIFYAGTYKNNILSPIFTFTLNGKTVTYNLNITVPDNVGTLSPLVINLNNRQDYTFTAMDFITRHNDLDGDSIVEIYLSGNVNNIRLNGISYIENTPIALLDISNGKLSYVAPNQDTPSSINLVWKIKDNKNNIIV